MIWTLTFPWPRPILSLNDRYPHWAVKAQRVATVKQTTALLAHNAGIPKLDHATVQLRWTVPDRRRRDSDNPVATFKVCCDALVPSIVPDDNPQWMEKLMPVIVYEKGVQKVELIIEGTP